MMALTSIGDLATAFVSRQQNLQIRLQLNTLTRELSSGVAADMPAHLGGDGTRLSGIDRQLSLTSGYADATSALGQRLATMQTVLGTVEERRLILSEQLMRITPASSLAQMQSAGDASGQTFADIVGSLNMRFGGKSLFAGSATDQPALADAQTMLADLRLALAGAVTATDVTTIVDDWFDHPAGGFATAGYLGDTGPALQRSIDSRLNVTISARADQQVIRDLLKASAIGALATDPALALPVSTASTLIHDATVRLLSVAEPLTDLRADLGFSEERVAAASTRHAAQLSAFGIMRNDMTQVDPYATASALQEVQAQLETHYTLTARLSNLSLVGYLR
jgi:flagellar hook-associated protein 3 FlgL